jgi:hypothetical protein
MNMGKGMYGLKEWDRSHLRVMINDLVDQGTSVSSSNTDFNPGVGEGAAADCKACLWGSNEIMHTCAIFERRRLFKRLQAIEKRLSLIRTAGPNQVQPLSGGEGESQMADGMASGHHAGGRISGCGSGGRGGAPQTSEGFMIEFRMPSSKPAGMRVAQKGTGREDEQRSVHTKDGEEGGEGGGRDDTRQHIIAVGARVSIYWDGESSWFNGTVMDFCSQKGYLVLYDDDESHWEPSRTVTAGERELDGTPIIPALERDRRLIPVSSESKAESEETRSCVATLASALEKRGGDGRHKLSEQDQKKEKERRTQMMNLSCDLYQQALQEGQRRETAAAHAPNNLRPYSHQNPYWQATLGAQSHAGSGEAAQKTRRDKVSERQTLKMRQQPVSLPPLPSVSKRRKSDPKRTLNTIFEGAVQAMWDENRSFPFRSAVNCPQYRALIANPMDLKVMKTRCYGMGRFESAGLCRSEALYDSKEEFVADVAKMVSNCRTYNEFRNPQLVSDVLELEQICHSKLEESKSAIVEAEAMIGLGRKLAAWTQELMTAEVEQPQTPTSTRMLKFEAFVAPVTTKEYSNVIRQPMDLKRMMSKAQSYSYCSHRGWLEDLRLVRDNCHLFCATRHPDLPPIADQLLARGEALAGEDSGILQTLEGQVVQRERERARVRESKKERDRKREREREKFRERAKTIVAVPEGALPCVSSLQPSQSSKSLLQESLTLPLRWTQQEEDNNREISKLLPGRSPGAIHLRWNKMRSKMVPRQRSVTATDSTKYEGHAIGSCGKRRRECSKRPKVPPTLFIHENSIDLLFGRPQHQQRRPQQQRRAPKDDAVNMGKRKEKRARCIKDDTGISAARSTHCVTNVRFKDKNKDTTHTGCQEALHSSQLHTAAAQAQDSQNLIQQQRQFEHGKSVASHAAHAIAHGSPPLISDEMRDGEEGSQQLHVRAAMQLPAQKGGGGGDLLSQQEEEAEIFEFPCELTRSIFVTKWRRIHDAEVDPEIEEIEEIAQSGLERNVPACAIAHADQGKEKEWRMSVDCEACRGKHQAHRCIPIQPGAELVGERVQVYWDGEEDWFAGYVSRYCPYKKRKPHFVRVEILESRLYNGVV